MCLPLLFPCSAARAETIEELTMEQAEQVAENFQALRDSVEQGVEKIGELQEKLEEIKGHGEWLADRKHGKALKNALDRLEKEGLSGKLQGAKDALETIGRSADRISGTAEEIKGRYDKVKEFHDKWHPDRNNPVRPLELVANALEELEGIVQSLDPSPDNVLTRPITALIAYYKESSTAFAGALTRVQEQIEARRQNCIGVGCQNYSVMGEAFAAKFPGVGPAWHYRPLQEGEIWYDGEGRAFLWWNDGWQELQGGLHRFEEVHRGWRLAHGQVVTTANLVGRMNTNYERVIEAKRRAEGYWGTISSTDACHVNVFGALRARGLERDRVLAEANNDRETFIARYMFNDAARPEIDRVVAAFDDTLLVRGFVSGGDGQSIAGARISASSPAGAAGATTDASGAFSLAFSLKPDASQKQNASVTVTHGDYAQSDSEQRLWNKCEDWRITLQDRDGGASVAELQSLRDTALARAGEVEAMCGSVEADVARAGAELDARAAPPEAVAGGSEGVDLAALEREAGEVAGESDALAKSLAQTSQSLGGQVGEICRKAGAAQSADAATRRQRLGEASGAQNRAENELATLRSGFARLNALSAQAESIRQRAEEGGTAAKPAGARPEAGIEKVRETLARAGRTRDSAEAVLDEIETLRTRAALFLSQGGGDAGAEAAFAEITTARDRAAACIAGSGGKLDGVAGRLGEIEARSDAGAEPAPTGGTEQKQRITALTEEAINNALIAERFFSVSEMEARLAESATCIAQAEAVPGGTAQGDLAAALDRCDLDAAAAWIARNDGGDPALIGRYEELRGNEQAAMTGWRRADALYRDCRYAEAEQALIEASGYRVCEATHQQLIQSMLTVKAGRRKYEVAEDAWEQAEAWYRQGNYRNSHSWLQQARAEAQCGAQIAKIDRGFQQVAAKLQEEAGGAAGGAAVAGGAGSGSSVCDRYSNALVALGRRQEQLAAQLQGARTEQQAQAIGNQVMQNSQQVVGVLDKARAAGCHDVDIPDNVRTALGVAPAPGASGGAGAGMQCTPPREPGYADDGTLACLCPGKLVWSERQRRCVTFGELLNEDGDMDRISDSIKRGNDSLRR